MPVISGGKIIEGSLPRLGGAVAVASSGAPSTAGMMVYKATYDFAVNGGAQGAINLLAGAYIPSGFMITGGVVRVRTAVTGVNATVAVSVEGANDIITASAISGAPWSTTGNKSVIPVGTGVTAILTTAARNIVATVATADLTAGVFDVYLYGFQTT